MTRHLVIVGGGIAGLSSAYYAQKAAAGHDLKITLVESSDRLGGKIITDRPDGFVIEGGPDSFITQKPWGVQLCRELGLDDQLIGTNDDRRVTYILRNGKLHQMPDGLMLIVPTRFMPFIKSGLISWRGKLRMGMELFIKPRTDDADESIAGFMRRRLGQEALDVLGEPLLAGIHVADAETLSLMATFPRFRDIERKYGSMTKGMIAARKNAPPSKQPLFMTMKGGLSRLVDRLSGVFEGDILTGKALRNLRAADGAYFLTLDDDSQLQADAVILATPAYVTARFIEEEHAELAGMLDGIRYVSTATVSLGYDANTFDHPLNGFGFVIPRNEPTSILACTWTSTKFDHRAPGDKVLLRAFVGGPRKQELVDMEDDVLAKLVQTDLKAIMGVHAQPEVVRVFRWQRSNPQYDVGHLDRVAQMKALCPDGIFLTGSAYEGVGIPDCVRQGQETAEQVIAYLSRSGV